MFGLMTKRRHEREMAKNDSQWIGICRAFAAEAEKWKPQRDAKGHFISREDAVMREIQDRDCSFVAKR